MKSQNLKRVVLIAVILQIAGINLKGQISTIRPINSVFITGIVFDSNTKEPLPNAWFTINHKSTSTTNETGRFSFYGYANDTVVFKYLGYQPTVLTVPDTLSSREYVMGVFLREQAVNLAEIIILRRVRSSSIMIKPVHTDQNTMNIAQSNVDNAVAEGLTRRAMVYDADMNFRRKMITDQIRGEYKGMLVSPENFFGLSTQEYKNYNVIYGTPIITKSRATKELATNYESDLLIQHFDAVKRGIFKPIFRTDTIIGSQKPVR